MIKKNSKILKKKIKNARAVQLATPSWPKLAQDNLS
jgi:hypothetical protein